ncbi:MAG: ATP-binding cassette domain-containing protein, partial [Gemmatimonadetes bacterium]|nr:ATP-binding cassette domain-containing protein [Gemmatimonadota bacterium]
MSLSGPVPSTAKPIVEYHGVHKAFDVPVLSGVSFSVRTGEMFALFGPSGTGKSVLLKTTIGLIVPDRGDVLVEGESVYQGGKGTLERIRRKVGYVFQNAALFDSLNVRDNVAMGIPEDVLAGLDRQETTRRAWEALD